MHPPAPTPSTPPGRPLSRWIKAIALILILLGIGFRSTNLDLKPFWEDEVYTITRVSGYQGQTIREQLDQQRLTVADLEKYRDPQAGQSWLETMSALASTPEHTPLYFMLLRVWSGIFGHSTAALRSLSVVFSVVGIGVFYLLGRSLFPTDNAMGDAAGWGTMTLASVSPLLLRYAQETRSYSLWIIGLGLSLWALLRAWRSPSKQNWCIYGLTLVLAFYTHLLTLLVIVAHGIALIIHGLLNRWQQTPLKGWLQTTLISCIFMGPWLALVVRQREMIKARTNWQAASRTLGVLMHSWGKNFSHTWLEIPAPLQPMWYLFPIVCFIGVAITSFYLWRHSQRNSIVTVLSFTLVPTLAILAMDLLSGGQRSTINRYLIPAYVGLLTLSGSALGCMLAGRVGQRRLSVKTVGLWSGSVLLLLLSNLSMGELHRASTWWHRSSHIPNFVHVITKEPDAILVTDRRIGETLALTYALPPEQELIWIEHFSLPNSTGKKGTDKKDSQEGTQGKRFSLPIEDRDGIVLFTPTKPLQEVVQKQRKAPLPDPIADEHKPNLNLRFLPPAKP